VFSMMKTTMHLHRPPAAPAAPVASPARLVTRHVRPSTLRLGVALSLIAAVLTLVLDVPVVLILVPVVIVGFALSWHACGRPLAAGRQEGSRGGTTERPPG
jgi:hypothetical protein